ncbi:MAG: asparaginase [Polyangiaceae bacterium]|nr:asparaginase [Polyangiaceae bacterium]
MRHARPHLKQNALKILTTGGTIDDLDYTDTESAPRRRPSYVHHMLTDSRVRLVVEVEEVLFKDSRQITDADRKRLAERAAASSATAVVITHGTFSMAETARFLRRTGLPKTIVLVGAMVPATRRGSDAQFNLGAAVVAAQVLPRGVYVAMNGQIFPGATVEKDPHTGFFYESAMTGNDENRTRRWA